MKFCHPAMPIRDLDGRTVAVQDVEADGEVCEIGGTNQGTDTLGIDCKVRAPDGTVLDTVISSRDDGTCGSDSPRS